MELQLKVELTDEQYDTLMTKSIDSVLNSPEAVAAMQKTIADSLGEYLTKHPDIVKDQFYNHNAYGWTTGTNDVTKKIISDAAAKTAETVKTAVSEYMLDVAKSQDLEGIVHHILIQAILAGAVDGLGEWKGRVGSEMMMLSGSIMDIKSRLGMGD